MTTETEAPADQRAPLSRERVLRAAVQLADHGGIEAVSMRKVGNQLGVEAMSLYNHVANKEEMLDGMVDLVVGEIDQSQDADDWQPAMRQRVLAAREVMVRHPWAAGVIESRINMSATMLQYMDSAVGILLRGGFSLDLAHHALHALGSRILGFNQELFDDSEGLEESPEVAALMMQQMTEEYPNISAMIGEVSHEGEPIGGKGCDDQVEFVFGLDLLLDGLEARRAASES
ncbi:MAG: TetR/AcrR family transcriptional regulator C-terminal domain-containing protein [Acidimicrobiia bacterium]